jgi:hypothetical protein
MTPSAWSIHQPVRELLDSKNAGVPTKLSQTLIIRNACRVTTKIYLQFVSANIFFFISLRIYNNHYFTVATSTDGACEIDAQCSTPFENSECEDAKCRCLETHVENTAKNKCLLSNFYRYKNFAT